MIGVRIIGIVKKSLIRQSVEERFQLGFLQIGEPHAAIHHMVHQRVDVFGILHTLAVDISYVILYMFQCHSPKLSSPHRVQKTVLYICVSFAVSHTGLISR